MISLISDLLRAQPLAGIRFRDRHEYVPVGLPRPSLAEDVAAPYAHQRLRTSERVHSSGKNYVLNSEEGFAMKMEGTSFAMDGKS